MGPCAGEASPRLLPGLSWADAWTNHVEAKCVAAEREEAQRREAAWRAEEHRHQQEQDWQVWGGVVVVGGGRV